MSRFYHYGELIAAMPVPVSDISWLAGQVSQLPPFVAGVAVLCGSVAWGQPSWRSDIDVVTFRTKAFPDIGPLLQEVVVQYGKAASRPLLLPRADTIVIGAEAQHLVTRKNLVRGSTPITQTQTIREVFAATGLRFFDHIGALARSKGVPWLEFHSSYLSRVARDRQTRRDGIRTYVTSFVDTWRQAPLRSLSLNPGGSAQQSELDAMAFAENFPIHLMRQILAERESYPSPDRAPDVRRAFAALPNRTAKRLLSSLAPFFQITGRYAEIIKMCQANPPIAIHEYHERLVELFMGLPFADVEEAVWDYLGPAD